MPGFDNSVVYANNVNFTGEENNPVETMIEDGQLIIGSEALNAGGTHINIGNIVSLTPGILVGYVSPNITLDLAGGGAGIDQIAVNSATGTGTNPVVPDGAGQITVLGAQTITGTAPILTISQSANAYTIQVQQSGSAIAQDTTLNGVAHFNSADFTVTNGFVSIATGAAVETITGGPGITITGTAANPIVNSVVFVDTTATTLAIDTGYFCTAAGTYNMPATALQGEMIIVVAEVAGVILDCPASNIIRVGSMPTSSGGTATSTASGDSLTLRYRLATLTWEAVSSMGIWTLA